MSLLNALVGRDDDDCDGNDNDDDDSVRVHACMSSMKTGILDGDSDDEDDGDDAY